MDSHTPHFAAAALLMTAGDLFLAGLLLRYSRPHQRSHLRDWAFGWLAMAGYHCADALGMIVAAAGPPAQPVRAGLLALALVCGYWQLAWLVRGIGAVGGMRRLGGRAFALVLAALAGLTLLFTLIPFGTDPNHRPSENVPFSLVSAAVFAAGAWFVLTRWPTSGRLGQRLLASVFILCVVENVYDFIAGWWDTPHLTIRPLADMIDLLLQAGVGLGMVVWMFEDEHRRALEGVAALRASEERYLSLMDQAADGIFLTDAATQFLDANPRGCAMLGRTREELLTLHIPDVIAQEDQGRLGETIAALSAGRPHYGEWRLWRKDGSLVLVEVSSNRLSDGRLLGIARDITERRGAEQALRESESRFRLLADNATDMIARHALDGTFLYVSPACQALLGYTPEELLGGSGCDLLHPEDLRDCQRAYERLLASPEAISTTYRMRRKDGSYVWLETVSRAVAVEGAPGGKEVHAASRDVTARKRDEETLLIRNQALDSAVTGIVFSDPEGRVTYVNRAFLDLLGLRSPGEALGQPGRELFPYPDRIADIRAALRAEGRWVGEETLPRRDGASITVQVAISVARDPGGRPICVLASLVDVTARQQAEERLRASLGEKEALLKEIHHRVKNNLQVIHSLLSLQAGRIHDPAALAVLRESRNRVLSMALIHEHLYRSGDLSGVDLSRHIESLCAELSRSYAADAGRVTLRTDVDAGAALDLDRAVPLGLVINELVSNAMKHAFPDGRRGSLRVALHSGPVGTYTLRIADDGIGLPPWLRMPPEDSLGLQLVDALVRQLGGTLTVERDHGTAFTMSFSAAGEGR